MADISSHATRVCLINPYSPSVSPRLTRNADMLSEAGYDVIVVTTSFAKRLRPHDRDLPSRRWNLQVVDMADSWTGQVRWQFARVRRRACLVLADRFLRPVLIKRACCYAGPELASLATRQKAALYIAHTHAALPSSSEAATRTGARLMFDAEDLLAESSAEPVRLMRAIEQSNIGQCSMVTTMSRAAAARLRETLKLPEMPMVLHNTPSLKERDGLVPPEKRPETDMLSIYWFGQTIGPHSCAIQILRALPLLARPAKLVLRGTPSATYVRELQRLALELGVSDRLQVCERALPGEMVRLAGAHDILVGSQPSAEPFHQMAVGNKVFTGLMAGMAIALTDTVAHRDLAEDLGESAVLFPNNDERGFASQLNTIITSNDRLLGAKRIAWQLAESRFNWESESKLLLRRVQGLIGLPV